MEKRSLFSLWGTQLLGLGLLSLVLSLISLSQPLYMLNIYDRVLTSQSAATLLSITAITLFVLICFGGFDWARRLVQEQMGSSLEKQVRPELLETAVRMAAVGHDARVRQRIAKLDELKNFVTGGTFSALFDLIFVPIYFTALYLFHPIIFLVALGLASGTVLLGLLSEWSLKGPMAEYWKSKYRLRDEEAQLTRNAADIVALGRVKPALARFLGRQTAVEAELEKTNTSLGRVQTFNKVITMMIQTLILGVTCYLVLRRDVSVGVLFAVNIVATRAMQPMMTITSSFRSLMRALDGWNDISDSLAKYRKDERAEQPITTAEVRIRSLTVLDHAEDRKILHNIHMDVDPGELVVVTGASGAGKSTLLRVMVGLVPDYVGTVELDNREIKHWRFSKEMAFIGYLPQDVRLFGVSLAENITGEEQPDMAALIALCQELGVHEDIAALKDGYQTLVNADAPQFSGGQVRLLGLARALWGNAPLLVLDEPTSGLDVDREMKVVQALRSRQAKGTALLLSSHSTNLIRAATKLMWLKWGQVKSYGLRDDVLTKMGQKGGAA